MTAKQFSVQAFSQSPARSGNVSIARLLGLGDDVRIQNPKLQRTAGRNPRWYIRPYVPIHTADGIVAKQQYIYLGSCLEVGKRKATASKNKVMEKINRHQFVVSSQLPFGEFIDTWLKTFVLSPGNLSSATQQKYLSHAESRIRPAFGHLRMGEIDTRAVDDWLRSMAAAGESYNYRKDLRNTLSGIFTKARKWGVWKEANPAMDATVGRARAAREKRRLSDEHMRMILTGLPADLAMICKLALVTLRISEALGLQEKHLDFTTGRILIRQRYYVGNIDVCKSRKSSREVPMGILVAQLKAMCIGDPERYLFGDWTYNKGMAILRERAKELGVYWEGFGFHQFRREAKTGLGATGIDPAQLMRLGGWSDVETALGYTLEDSGAQAEAVRKFQEKVSVQ